MRVCAAPAAEVAACPDGRTEAHIPIDTSDATPLIRTSFTDEEAWRRVVGAATSPSPDGFRAELYLVVDRSLDDADPSELARAVETSGDHALIVIADAETMGRAEMPLLCIDPIEPDKRLRVVPNQLWSIENNLRLANMDFEEFLNAVDVDGVFRGFGR